ncbi:MAG: Gfo/Idh/MocA family oxidoreductase [Defluviitaleaceae bacterium]|nr:Gfo/Idh/MocA family oxidoreductase [Defluviitaleaceae bacterium]
MNMKSAIIGLGMIAPMHIKSIEAIGGEVAVVCDNSGANIEKAGLNCPAFSDYKKMLASGGFEVLHICLPHYLHAEVAIAALEAGVHVLCEKPMATTIADAKKMIAASEKSGAFLGIVFQNRFSPGAMLIKNTLQSGELGAVKSGWLRVTWHRDEGYYAQSDWRGRWATEGGGVLINQSIHTFDMLNYFLGIPTAVNASIANRAHPKIEVEDVSEGVISYGKTNISFFVNTYHPYDAPVKIELICENGTAELTGEDATIIFKDGTKKTVGADLDAQKKFGMKSYWGVSHIKQIQAFYDSIAKNEPPTPSGEEGLITQKLINGIYESAKNHKTEVFL